MDVDSSERRPRGGIRIGIWIILAVGVIGYLVVTSISDFQLPYVSAADLPGASGRFVRVAGKVAMGGVELDGPGDISVTFALIDEQGDTVRVEYRGVRPDAFREGAQAVVEGTFDPSSRQFNAVLLQAKCPSKYEVGVATATQKS